ncbi:MAG: FliM/FliN family flagellar motor switch protein, partial [Bacteroidetes bacterium]|nr:FliM/FliN family flagellar motor switch protein [Bacteroidota bacterium]
QSKGITPIEQKVLWSIVERILMELKKAWQIIGDFNFEIEKFEPDIDFAQITSQSESVLLISFEIFIGEQSYLMNICFATYAFDSILSKLSSQSLSQIRPVKYHGTTAKNILINHLYQTKLNVTAEFGTTSITFSELMNLNSGDVIILNNKIGDEMKIYIDDKEVFRGIAGVSNNHKAVKIMRKIEKKE